MKKVLMLNGSDISGEPISLSAMNVDVNEQDYDYIFYSVGQRLFCLKAREGELGEYGPKSLYRLLTGMEMSTEMPEG